MTFAAREFVRTHTPAEVDAEVDRLLAKSERYARWSLIAVGVAFVALIAALVLRVVA